MANAGLPCGAYSPQERELITQAIYKDMECVLSQGTLDSLRAHRVTGPCEGWGQKNHTGHTGGWRPQSLESYSKPQAVPCTGTGVRRGGASLVWLMSARGSLPQLFGKGGDDGEGQEDHTSCASDDQAQDAAVHLHGLTALSRVEEGVIGDTPGEEDTWVHVGATGASSSSQTQAPTHQQWQ